MTDAIMSNMTNLNKSEIKDEQVNDLMKSIENKLSMLACDDSVNNFQQSKLCSPKRENLTATNQKQRHRMNIQDLQTSVRKQTKQSPSKLGQSRILSRINQMQHYYMDKIQAMSTKLASLQIQFEILTKANHELKNQNIIIKQNLSRKEKEQNQIVSKKIDQLKQQLIEKFAREAEEHFQLHIRQMKSINEDLLEEKGKRKYLQQQVTLLKTQKNNLEQFYKNLLQNHRNMIKMDIVKSEKAQKQQINHNGVGTKGEEQQSQGTKKKNRKKQRGSTRRPSQQMTKQQMIPFLAKGIQDLKDKLKIK